ncbi:MAG TPA: ribonuclease PH [bacterium]
MIRRGNRKTDEIRKPKIETKFIKHAEGSALVEMGDTKLICTATVIDGVPDFLKNTGRGWVTAEYSMLPRATSQRKPRESTRGKQDGRSQEIQRIIGRALRAVVNFRALGERTLWIDCDVFQADGSTRTASITGGFIALKESVNYLLKNHVIIDDPLLDSVAAVSVGIVDGEHLLDLDYNEDSHAEVDLNVVMTGAQKIVEVQGTAEQSPFTIEQLTALIDLAKKGIKELTEHQRIALS